MNDLHRIIDANTNRASEGLRVLEDLARFSLNDEHLSKRLKDLRHQLRSTIGSLGLTQADLLVSRDTSGDVGTRINTPQEQDRADGRAALATAASKRAQEALRVLEESAKALGRDGSSFESIRYALYDLQRDLTLALSKPSPYWPVCVLITQSLCTHRSPQQVIQDAARAGAGCMQIREKDMDGDELFAHASAMTSIGHEHGLCVIINDRVEIAAAVNADGVHLGQHDLPISAARSILGPQKLIGRSCANLDQLREAFAQGADYCGLGPIFPSTTKAKPTLSGIDTLRAAINDPELSNAPMLAISGITPGNIAQIASLGFPGVAVSSSVCSTEDPYQACKAMVESMSPTTELA